MDFPSAARFRLAGSAVSPKHNCVPSACVLSAEKMCGGNKTALQRSRKAV